MGFFTIVAIVSLACEAYDAFVKKGDAHILPREYVEEIVNAINQAKYEIISEIINEMRLIRLADLDGDVMGLATRFDEYDRYDRDTEYDKWQSEGERLREIIDDSAMVIADLEAEQERLNLSAPSDLEHAIRVLGLSSVLVPFRSMVMEERTITYGTDDRDEIPPMWEKLTEQANSIKLALKARSDNQFSSDYVTRRGEPMGHGTYTLRFGYLFNGRFIFVIEAPPRGDHSMAIQKARERLERHKNGAAASYPGMEVVTAILEQAT